MLDEGDEDIFRIVLFEGKVGIERRIYLYLLRGRHVLRLWLVVLELGTHDREVSH